MEEKQNVMIEEDEPSFDFKQLWRLYTRSWRWFIVSIVLCVLIAIVYLWLTPTTVTVTGKMEIINKSKKGSSGLSAGLSALNSLPLGLGSSLAGAAGAGAIDFEKEILTSTTIARDVVKNLGLFTEYRLRHWGKKILLYQTQPVNVALDEAHVQWLDTELPLYSHQILLTISKGSNGYEVETTLVEGKDEVELPTQTFAQLPATIKTESGTLTLTENKLPEKQAKAYVGNYTMEVTIAPPTKVADRIVSRMMAEPTSKNVMNILELSLQDENMMRGIDYINHLVEAYNQRANDEKNEEARKTDEFVRERLAMVDAELSSSDAAWENSKKNFQITDPTSNAQEVMEKKNQYETQLVSIGVQLMLQDYLKEFVDNPANLFELIPVNVGMTYDNTPASGDAVPMISRHNALVNQRKNLLMSMSEQSPQVQRITQQIEELHPNIQTAMQRDRQAILIRKQNVEREYSKYMRRVNTAPQMERVLTEIGRERNIKQGVYLVMLQKREETALELANVTDRGKLIDPPAADPKSNKPRKKTVLFAALFFGALFPMGILYLLMVFKSKIDTRDELEALTKLPVLAELTSANADEAIRNLRTNLLLNLKDDQKTILVASNNDGDGKTFIAQHLSDSLTAIGQKAVLINSDLRSSSLSRDQHPADILAGAEFASQIAAAKSSNDYVILDSPAISKFADALQLSQFADATLYIVKAGKTLKSDLISLNSNTYLPNPLIVFNV